MKNILQQLKIESINRNNIVRTEDVTEVLSELNRLGKIMKCMHFKKSSEKYYYSEEIIDGKSSSTYDSDGNLHEFYRNVIKDFEQNVEKSYSNLFRVLKGNRNVIIPIGQGKLINVDMVLDKYEKAAQCDFIGGVDKCNAENIEKYRGSWAESLNIIVSTNQLVREALEALDQYYSVI